MPHAITFTIAEAEYPAIRAAADTLYADPSPSSCATPSATAVSASRAASPCRARRGARGLAPVPCDIPKSPSESTHERSAS